MFTPAANAAITDQMILDFADAYRANAGTFVRAPEGILETIQFAMKLQNAPQGGGSQNPNLQRRGNNVAPIPMEFTKGVAFVVIDMDPRGQGGAQPGSIPSKPPIIVNIGVMTSDGKEAWLLDPAKANELLGGSSAPDPDAAPDAPNATPAPSEPKPPTAPSGTP